MSQKILTLPRLNYASNFNFFFKNTKKNLVIEHNFIGNQYLISTYRKLITTSGYNNTKTISQYSNNIHHNDVNHDINSAQNSFEKKNLNLNTNTSTSTSSSSSNPNPNPNSILHNVATKVLTCQEPEAQLSQKITPHSSETKDASNNHIPFKVVPKQKKSNIINDISNIKTKSELRNLINPYIKLTKPNLTILVTLSCVCSYAISPYSVSLPELLFLTVGTALCSGAANAINMGREPEFDKRMARTSGRPVVRGLVTSKQSFQFAALTGSLGCSMLFFGVNPTVSLLGFANIVLYAWIYTSLKRKSIINTWVGAIVGAIPPLMGWAASSPISHPGALCLAGLLYAWQFPHFNALSHNVADQYKKAGYFMTAAENPRLNARVALRYSFLMFPLCFGLSYYGVTDWVFQFDSAVANCWLSYLAFVFWRQQEINYGSGRKPTAEGLTLASLHAKKLFWCSVWQLPAILVLAMLHKKGQWDKLFHFLGLKSTNNSSDAESVQLSTV